MERRYWECAMGGTTARNVLSAITVAFNAAILILTTYIAYSIRNIAARYNESKLIGLAVYNIVVLVTIIPIISATTGNPVVIPVGILVLTSVVYAIYFLPKVITLITGLEIGGGQGENKHSPSSYTGDSESGHTGTDSTAKAEKREMIEGYADIRIARSKFLLGTSRWVRRQIVLVPMQSIIAEIPMDEASEFRGTTVLVEELKVLNVVKNAQQGFSVTIQINNKLFWEVQTGSAETIDQWVNHFKAVRGSRKMVDTLSPLPSKGTRTMSQ
ncbi:uncharacterized protein SPPG_05364 [Spizellomyces punctatus DAOM BR117]|uniref:G-protein coupled receptors family 3 profile domain-containing protein n=1 Tax=Spizellomyces punctatus (strain DAOM BR117) TaxID=645134 RepID=A0A0L0HC47_SPIPD|nr:uncharacterized protein SPPG_05364 [Spizellomyces punctatus DAOM BR117]KNC99105.1 hypothetical protein SPPG_05364 [Spizellomyces punctatus DAOM BR117]|eukprot:XP_016607145.1 hypothetical protein SPPG_05364 [Spizellomyces punctatus DAOM BR117]